MAWMFAAISAVDQHYRLVDLRAQRLAVQVQIDEMNQGATWCLHDRHEISFPLAGSARSWSFAWPVPRCQGRRSIGAASRGQPSLCLPGHWCPVRPAPVVCGVLPQRDCGGGPAAQDGAFAPCPSPPESLAWQLKQRRCSMYGTRSNGPAAAAARDLPRPL